MEKIIVAFFTSVNIVFSFALIGYAQEVTQQPTDISQADNSQSEVVVRPMTEIVVDKNNQQVTEQSATKIVEETAKEVEKAEKKKEEDKATAAAEEKDKEKDKEKNPEEWGDDETGAGTFSDSRQSIWRTGGSDNDIRSEKDFQFRP
ncbi:MAG: hypothetical protein WCI77_10935 [Candidatus Omnitrophota bacterium]